MWKCYLADILWNPDYDVKASGTDTNSIGTLNLRNGVLGGVTSYVSGKWAPTQTPPFCGDTIILLPMRQVPDKTCQVSLYLQPYCFQCQDRPVVFDPPNTRERNSPLLALHCFQVGLKSSCISGGCTFEQWNKCSSNPPSLSPSSHQLVSSTFPLLSHKMLSYWKAAIQSVTGKCCSGFRLLTPVSNTTARE